MRISLSYFDKTSQLGAITLAVFVLMSESISKRHLGLTMIIITIKLLRFCFLFCLQMSSSGQQTLSVSLSISLLLFDENLDERNFSSKIIWFWCWNWILKVSCCFVVVSIEQNLNNLLENWALILKQTDHLEKKNSPAILFFYLFIYLYSWLSIERERMLLLHYGSSSIIES